MKNIRRFFFLAVFAAFLTIGVASCGNSPNSVAKDFAKAFEKLDGKAAAKLFAEKKDRKVVEAMFKEIKKAKAKITVEIGEIDVDGDDATVEITITAKKGKEEKEMEATLSLSKDEEKGWLIDGMETD